MRSNVVIVSLSVLTSLARATLSVPLNPSADTFVSSANAANNYGFAGALEVSAAGLPKGEFQSLLRFDTSSAKSNFDTNFGAGMWTVQSVSLQLMSAGAANPLFNANAAGQFAASWMPDDSWVEGTGTSGAPTSDGVTWSTLGTFLSGSDQAEGTFNFVGGNSGTGVYDLPVGSGLAGDIAAGSVASLRLFAADSAVSYLANSRTGAVKPVLTITAVPEPASGTLLLAFAGMLLRHRSRR